MTLRLAGRQAKEEIIDLLRKVILTFIFPNISMASRDALMEHIAWMKRQSGELSVNCRFETFPELHETKITITASFEQLAPEQRN